MNTKATRLLDFLVYDLELSKEVKALKRAVPNSIVKVTTSCPRHGNGGSIKIHLLHNMTNIPFAFTILDEVLPGIAKVHGTFVIESIRGKRVYEKLAAVRDLLAKKAECQMLMSSIRADNHSMLTAAKRNGWEIYKSLHLVRYNGVSDVYIMVKLL